MSDTANAVTVSQSMVGSQEVAATTNGNKKLRSLEDILPELPFEIELLDANNEATGVIFHMKALSPEIRRRHKQKLNKCVSDGDLAAEGATNEAFDALFDHVAGLSNTDGMTPAQQLEFFRETYSVLDESGKRRIYIRKWQKHIDAVMNILFKNALPSAEETKK